MGTMDKKLEALSEPFERRDITWRVSRCAVGSTGKVWCKVLAYITNRAIMARLDDVMGPNNWRNEEPRILTIDGRSYFSCGLSLNLGSEESPHWVTKWDVCEPGSTRGIDAAKSGWSGAMKRAGAQWGIGRYLYYLTEEYAEVRRPDEVDRNDKTWNRGTTPKDRGNQDFMWKPPRLPGWALPKPDEVTRAQLAALKNAWAAAFAKGVTDPNDLRDAFEQFVEKEVGEGFPGHDNKLWDKHAFKTCMDRINAQKPGTKAGAGVPFQ
jgi:hypothetical protein